jgi:type IV secretory pathway VirB2 component (pilin)
MSHPSMRAALALACMVALAVPAAAAGSNPSAERAAVATEQYYSSYGTDPANAHQTRSAIAAERYYSSYGAPQPLAKPSAGAAVSPAPADSMPSALIAVLLVVAAGIGVAAGRVSTRRRPRLRSHSAHEPSTT